MGSLFKTKRTVQTIFFDVAGVMIRAPLENYLQYGCEIFECSKDDLQTVTSLFLPDLERGKLSSETYWENVSREISEKGLGKAIPAWRFKGFWEGLLSDDLRVDQDMTDLVRRLKSHVRVGALSNVIKEHAVQLQRTGVYDHFHLTVLSCKIGARKPDSECYREAAKLAQTDPERCLLVDDLVENLEGAQKSGFRFLHFTGLDPLKRELYRMGFLDNG